MILQLRIRTGNRSRWMYETHFLKIAGYADDFLGAAMYVGNVSTGCTYTAYLSSRSQPHSLDTAGTEQFSKPSPIPQECLTNPS